MDWVLRVLIARLIWRGNLRLTTVRGTRLTFGDGTGPLIAARFTSRAAEFGVLVEPELKLGEAYMNGTFVMEQGSIADQEMERVFNMGVGMVAVVGAHDAGAAISLLASRAVPAWLLGEITEGAGAVRLSGQHPA